MSRTTPASSRVSTQASSSGFCRFTVTCQFCSCMICFRRAGMRTVSRDGSVRVRYIATLHPGSKRPGRHWRARMKHTDLLQSDLKALDAGADWLRGRLTLEFRGGADQSRLSAPQLETGPRGVRPRARYRLPDLAHGSRSASAWGISHSEKCQRHGVSIPRADRAQESRTGRVRVDPAPLGEITQARVTLGQTLDRVHIVLYVGARTFTLIS